MLYNITSLIENLDEYFIEVDLENNRINQFVQSIGINQLEVEDKQKLTNILNELSTAYNKGLNLKTQLNDLHLQGLVIEGGIEVTNWWAIPLAVKAALEGIAILVAAIAAAVKELIKVAWEQLKDKCKDVILEIIKQMVDSAVNTNEYLNPDLLDAAQQWNIASDIDKALKYIEKNAQLIKSTNDLNYKLQKTVKAKLLSQVGVKDSIGFVFEKGSSVSTDIATSQEFKNLINDNKNKDLLIICLSWFGLRF